jgi:hypothetical protein
MWDQVLYGLLFTKATSKRMKWILILRERLIDSSINDENKV